MVMAGSKLLCPQLSRHVVLLGFGQKVGVCATGQPSVLTPRLTLGTAAQRGKVAPQGHTASRRQSQGQLRHTQKTDGQILRPGQLWPVERPPGEREGVPADLGVSGICVLACGPGALITTGGCFGPACTQEGDRPLKHSGCPQLQLGGSPGSHPPLQLHCRCTQTGSGHQPPSRMPGT